MAAAIITAMKATKMTKNGCLHNTVLEDNLEVITLSSSSTATSSRRFFGGSWTEQKGQSAPVDLSAFWIG